MNRWLITGLNIHLHVDCFRVLVAQVSSLFAILKRHSMKTLMTERASKIQLLTFAEQIFLS